MPRKMIEHEERHRREDATSVAPVEESLLIRQRLRNLCELAIAIGQRKGLLGNQKKTEKGDKDVTAKRKI